ncbi:MAG: elongation factor Tu [Anaerolineae bacterium]|nr:elongation factor Tu [Anaerolineae bacterium]
MARERRFSRRDFLHTGAVLVSIRLWPQITPRILDARWQQGSSRPPVHLGVLGHLDHGKTTLTAAITHVLALIGMAEAQSYEVIDRAPEGRALGVPLDYSSVGYETGDRSYMLVDCPAHSDCVKNLITGAVPLDGAIVVVSAPDGAMPQTREHLLLAAQLKVPAIVVFLNKTDQMDDPELLELIELELRELLGMAGFSASTPIVRGSALQALESSSRAISAPEYAPIVQLTDTIDQWIPTPLSAAEKPFYMPLEDVFSIKGRGTVVTGTVAQGVLTKGDEIAILGLQDEILYTTVTGIEMFHKEFDSAQTGEAVGVLLRGIEASSLTRGMVLAQPGSIAVHRHFQAEVYVLLREEGGRQTAFFNGYRPQFGFGPAAITGIITLPDGVEMMMLGDDLNLDVELIVPMALQPGSRFTIAEGGLTVGVGVVTDLLD